MLILSRLVGESIVIGDGIKVMVAQVKGDRVKLGVTAPLNVPVHREEVYDREQQRILLEAAKAEIGEPSCENSAQADWEGMHGHSRSASEGGSDAGPTLEGQQ